MSVPDATPTDRLARLVGVYDADGTPWGEVAYWVGARLGRRHCSLCEITHGASFTAPEDGRYTFSVEGEAKDGSFALAWEIG